MKPYWPKLARLAQENRHFGCFQICQCVHCSQGSFLLESIIQVPGLLRTKAVAIFKVNW